MINDVTNGGVRLEFCKSIRNLGDNFDENHSFEDHKSVPINFLTSKAFNNFWVCSFSHAILHFIIYCGIFAITDTLHWNSSKQTFILLKFAPFNCMAYRMCNIPLSPTKFETEKHRIYDTRSQKRMDMKNMLLTHAIVSHAYVKRYEKRVDLENLKNLSTIKEKSFDGIICSKKQSKIPKTFERENVCVAPKNSTILSQLLVSTKDTIPTMEKPGIHYTTCSQCAVKYISAINNMPHRSASTQHLFTQKKHNRKKLDILESLHIQMNDNNINRDSGPCTSLRLSQIICCFCNLHLILFIKLFSI